MKTEGKILNHRGHRGFLCVLCGEVLTIRKKHQKGDFVKYSKLKRIHIFLLLFFCILIFFVITGCGGNTSRKISFSQSDTDGLWKMVGFGLRRHDTFNSYGSLIVDASGAVTGGDLTSFGVDIKTFTGGIVSTTVQGAVTGSIDTFLADSNTTEKHTILGGQMTLNRDVIVYAGNFPISNRGLGILIRKRGNFTGFDLEGTWVFPLEGIFSVSINNSGAITGCSFLSNKGDSGTCRGTFSINPQGVVSGQIEAINGKTFKIDFNGQMNSSKNVMIFAGSMSTRFEGAATFAVRRDGAFSLADGQGNWKIFITENREAIYGTITFENSGKVTGGNWTMVGRVSGTFTGGTLSISKQGDVSGFINTSTGNSYTILGVQMSPDKDFTGGMVKDNSGRFRVMVFLKIP
jgi:hypothetical protein